MARRIVTAFLFLSICMAASADDSIPSQRPHYISLSFSDGLGLSNKKIRPDGKYSTPHLSALHLKYGIKAKGDKWQDYLYEMPYKGIGVYMPYFSSVRRELGNPFSVFLFQGATIKEFSPYLSLHYEINLGVSFNWKHFNAINNPEFIVFGSSTNVHLGGNGYFKWRLSNRFDLHAGLSITHFSNGALRTPNNGLNTLTAFVELAYNINETKTKRNIYQLPVFKKNRVHDLSLLFTTRTLKVDIDDSGLRSKYPKERFKVAGLSYAYMFHSTHRFKWGPSIEAVYDESVNTSFKGRINEETGQYREYYKLGKVGDRFSIGLSLKGEISMPGYSIFANLGYDIYHKDKRDKRFYQIYGLKVYLIDNMFATFGVRSTEGTHSQYLYLNVGYTFQSKH